MKRYYKYDDTYTYLAPATTYVELKHNWAERQITYDGENFIASNRPDWDLPDQEFEESTWDEVVEIEKSKFEEIWNCYLEAHRETWRHTKESFLIGEEISGTVAIFYPQGTIIQIEEKVFGVVDTAAYRDALPSEEILSTKRKATATVAGYDEVNQWLILKSPNLPEES